MTSVLDYRAYLSLTEDELWALYSLLNPLALDRKLTKDEKTAHKKILSELVEIREHKKHLQASSLRE